MKAGVKVAVALFAGLAALSSEAELIGSLHVSAGVDVLDVDVAGSLAIRSGNGDLNTRGTVGGSINFLAGTAGQLISDLRGFSASTTLRDLNRFGNNANGGSVVT